jgi:hypothetical protein
VYANPINSSSEKASVIVVVERLEKLRRERLKYVRTILNLAASSMQGRGMYCKQAW